ncbi:histidine phosphatase family protein [Steroidobacter cummioxidans]|uniref:histidine phosphatase family protein n=1 Tax=Steroidobacter cummioxidans TaxID=1803913 RepID=UPI000E30E374|nr:histidine phosphatase family protein [Steroidobacter cummioxidans]
MTTRELLLVRHGETEWSLSGQHTGRTDIPLTENGRVAAKHLAPLLASRAFALVLTSPLQRARETCQLAGLGAQAQTDADLLEWDYGAYEGLTPQQIRAERPTWMIFTDGCPDGETPQQVAERIDRVIARVRAAIGNVAVFAHGHVLRVFAARWLGLPPSAGSHFMLSTATVSVLSSYHGIAAIKHWNAPLMSSAPQVTESEARGAGDDE